MPVNLRASRAPSLSMIRQCRKARSEGSSFFSEKFTLNIGLAWVCGILPPHCVRLRGQSITHIGVPSVVGQADTAQLLYLSFLPSTPARLSEKKTLTNRTLRFVIIPVSYLGDFLSFLCVEAIRFCGSLCNFFVWADRSRASAAIGAGLLAARPGAPSAGVHSRLLVAVQFDRSPYLLLDPNHSEPNPLAQTLRIFLARLLRLFLRFEWLG